MGHIAFYVLTFYMALLTLIQQLQYNAQNHDHPPSIQNMFEQAPAGVQDDFIEHAANYCFGWLIRQLHVMSCRLII